MATKPRSEETPSAPSPPARPDLPGTEPRPVTDPLTVSAAVLGYNSLGMTAFGRYRLGLLDAVAAWVLSADPSLNIDAARAAVLEDVAFVNLLLRPRTAEPWPPSRHKAVCERLQALAGERLESVRVLPARAVKWVVQGPDRPGFLRDVCRLLTQERVGVRGLQSDLTLTYSGASPAGEPACQLTFRLELPASPPADLEALASRLTGLGARVRPS